MFVADFVRTNFTHWKLIDNEGEEFEQIISVLFRWKIFLIALREIFLLFRAFISADADLDGAVSEDEFEGMINAAAAFPQKFGFEFWKGSGKIKTCCRLVVIAIKLFRQGSVQGYRWEWRWSCLLQRVVGFRLWTLQGSVSAGGLRQAGQGWVREGLQECWRHCLRVLPQDLLVLLEVFPGSWCWQRWSGVTGGVWNHDQHCHSCSEEVIIISDYSTNRNYSYLI